MEDLYARLKQELAALWEQLRIVPMNWLEERKDVFREKMRQIGNLADEIGGSVQKDVGKLLGDIENFLEGKLSLSEMKGMMEQSLKVEQDTREL